MKRWICVRAGTHLNHVRRPGGKYITRSPVWVDSHEARDFYVKLIRQNDLDLLAEDDMSPGEKSVKESQRLDQARADLANTENAIKGAEAEIEAIAKKAEGAKSSGKKKEAVKAALEEAKMLTGAVEERLAVLKNTAARLRKELGEEKESS